MCVFEVGIIMYVCDVDVVMYTCRCDAGIVRLISDIGVIMYVCDVGDMSCNFGPGTPLLRTRSGIHVRMLDLTHIT